MVARPDRFKIALIASTEPHRGWVGLSMAPGRRDLGTAGWFRRSLDRDLVDLLELGTTALVPLITDDEPLPIGIPSLFSRAEAVGLEVLRFPFPDGGVPDDLWETIRFIDEICDRYRSGGRLVIHCRGGLGRSGTLGACVRLRLGLDLTAEQAIASIRMARSPEAIETRGQAQFVERYRAELDKSSV